MKELDWTELPGRLIVLSGGFGIGQEHARGAAARSPWAAAQAIDLGDHPPAAAGRAAGPRLFLHDPRRVR